MAPGDEYFTDLLKIEMTYSGERNTAANILYATSAAAHGATVPQLQGLADTIGASWKDNIVPSISSAITFENCSVADWTADTGLVGVYNFSQMGGATGTPCTAQVAMLVNLVTSLRYRGGRGRIYIPASDADAIDNDLTWGAGLAATMDTGLAAFYSAFNAALLNEEPVTWVLYHRGPPAKYVAKGVETVDAAVFNLTPGTQRRRVRRVGHLK
jgi:hypothetical protein